MGRFYTVTFENVAVTAAQDLISLLPAANKPCTLHTVSISQSTDYGDAAAEGLRIKIIRGHTTVGSGGSSATPAKNDPGNGTAAGVTARVNDTTIASSGTAVDLWAENWNIQVPFYYRPTPEERIIWANAEYLVVRLMAAPADSITCSGSAVLEEIY